MNDRQLLQERYIRGTSETTPIRDPGTIPRHRPDPVSSASGDRDPETAPGITGRESAASEEGLIWDDELQSFHTDRDHVAQQTRLRFRKRMPTFLPKITLWRWLIFFLDACWIGSLLFLWFWLKLTVMDPVGWVILLLGFVTLISLIIQYLVFWRYVYVVWGYIYMRLWCLDEDFLRSIGLPPSYRHRFLRWGHTRFIRKKEPQAPRPSEGFLTRWRKGKAIIASTSTWGRIWQRGRI